MLRILHLYIIIVVVVISKTHGRSIYTMQARVTVAVHLAAMSENPGCMYKESERIINLERTSCCVERRNATATLLKRQGASLIADPQILQQDLHATQVLRITRHATATAIGTFPKDHTAPDVVYHQASQQLSETTNNIIPMIITYILSYCFYKKLVEPHEGLRITKNNSTNLTADTYDYLNLTNIFCKPYVFVSLFYILMFSVAIYSVARSTKTIDTFVTKKVFSSDNFRAKQSDVANPMIHPQKNDLLESLLSTRHITPPATNLAVYSAAKLDGANSNLPVTLALQQQLDAMSPKEYLPYVLNELSLEERESLMIDETQRRKTFLINWPHDGDLSGPQLAKAGFYALNDCDRVQCVFCRGCLHKWEPTDIPMTEHKKSFPFCRFVKGMDCGNREYRGQQLTADDLSNVTKFGPEVSRKSKAGAIEDVSLGISTNRAAAPQHGCAATRKKSFRRWPAGKIVSPDSLSKAGFYYTGFADNVRCFYCSGGLTSWVEGDEPWVEHARWYPDCLFLIQNKGESFVETVQRETPSHKKCERRTEKQKKVEGHVRTKTSKHQDMKNVCLKLGHSAEAIAAVCEMNGKPFESASLMVDALYEFEENQLTVNDGKPSIETPINQRKERVVEMEADQVDGAGCSNRSTLDCWGCEAKAGFKKACHVGLPCGHLVYCENCNEEQLQRSRNPNYKVICPYTGCGNTLSGSMKTYLG